MPEVKGVWAHAAGGSRLWLTVAIKQQYAGHAKQAGLIASQCHAGAYANRFVVVVYVGIEPLAQDKVVWARAARWFDPRGYDAALLSMRWTDGLRHGIRDGRVGDRRRTPPVTRLPAGGTRQQGLAQPRRGKFSDVLPR